METHALPNEQEIIQRLKAADIFDDPYMHERLYPFIARKLANKELVPAGLSLALALAIYDWSQDYPPTVQRLVENQMDAIAAALVA